MKLKHIIGIIGFIIGAYCLWQLYEVQQESECLKIDLAESSHVKHGLFNPNKWKEQIAIAISQKIEELDVIGSHQEEIEEQLNQVLNVLIDQLNAFIESKINEGNLLGQFVKKLSLSMLYNEAELRKKVPDYTKTIMDHFDTTGFKQKAKEFIKKQIETVISSEESLKIQELKGKYETENHSKLNYKIKYLLEKTEQKKEIWIVGVFVSALVVFFIGSLKDKGINLLKLLAMLLLWVGAVIFPMMTVGAELKDVKFELIGAEISFEDQTLFYQSKSILSLVHTLFIQQNISSVVVGCLVAFFSMIFPIVKIILNFVYQNKSLKSKITHYILDYGAKWSMADVFVVAIFMAFIGLNSLITHQLGEIETTTKTMHIETVNLTKMHFPVLFFVKFVLMNILSSKRNNAD
ncbi:paraquat-inducible protein A [Capnocytophaga canimorsus]|uniref:paraquat-inducible protein A n=1 Tax=Capnocytophaga canimorsus TaxID=28188 RepID=UPI00385E8814